MKNTIPLQKKTDEHGKKIVWENGDYSISVNDMFSPSFLALWFNGEKIGSFFVDVINKNGKKWFKVSSIHINNTHRGKGLGKKFYQVLLSLPTDKAGIYSYLPDRSNKKSVPQIYKSLGGTVEDGDHAFIPKLNEVKVKSFIQFLTEMPLPSNWDTSNLKSFKQWIDYATKMSQKIGSGSSRVAFIIPFEGRDTVVKIAKNAKGLAQNEREADYGLHNMHGGVLIPLIDHDEQGDQPRWIHFEKADKLTDKKFFQLTGYSFKHFGNMIQAWEQDVKGRRGGINWKSQVPQEEQEKIEESELYDEVTNMVANFGFLMGDFTRLANWGVYKGKPVIIDYGFDEAIQKEYYTPKGQRRGW